MILRRLLLNRGQELQEYTGKEDVELLFDIHGKVAHQDLRGGKGERGEGGVGEPVGLLLLGPCVDIGDVGETGVLDAAEVGGVELRFELGRRGSEVVVDCYLQVVFEDQDESDLAVLGFVQHLLISHELSFAFTCCSDRRDIEKFAVRVVESPLLDLLRESNNRVLGVGKSRRGLDYFNVLSRNLPHDRWVNIFDNN